VCPSNQHRPRRFAKVGANLQLDERIATVSAEIEAISSAVVAAIGSGTGFRQGRDFGAWLELVLRQESTGDRTILGKISKRGNKYLRTLFVQAAHVVLARRPSAARASVETASSEHAGDCAR
jgi:transposase